MPRTEAGKRLLEDAMSDDPLFPADFGGAIDAIEAEAIRRAHEGDAEFLDDLTTELIAAERARIRAAVEHEAETTLAMEPKEWITIAAVLAIIDGAPDA